MPGCLPGNRSRTGPPLAPGRAPGAAGVLGLLCACAGAPPRSERPGWRRGGAPLLWQPGPRRRASRCWGLPRSPSEPRKRRRAEVRRPPLGPQPPRPTQAGGGGVGGGRRCGARCGAGSGDTPGRPRGEEVRRGDPPAGSCENPRARSGPHSVTGPLHVRVTPKWRRPRGSSRSSADGAGSPAAGPSPERRATRPSRRGQGRVCRGLPDAAAGLAGRPDAGQPRSSASSEGRGLSSTVSRRRSGGVRAARGPGAGSREGPVPAGRRSRCPRLSAVRRPVRPEPLAPSPAEKTEFNGEARGLSR